MVRLKGISCLAVAAVLLAAGKAQAQTQYITECVGRATQQAKSAGEYTGYGTATSSFSLLGGWITQGRSLSYSMTLEGGRSYLFVGGGDSDVKDLDISVSDGESAVEDTETDNTPFVHVEAESTVEVTITLTNYAGSGQPDFCALIILQKGGGAGNLTSLDQAASGLVQLIDALAEDWGTDTSSWCVLGGLFGAGGELGIHRNFDRGDYLLVGWGDGAATDLDAAVADGEGELVAVDTEEDKTPVVPFEVTGNGLRGTLMLRMAASRGNAFGVCTVLKQR